MPHSKSLTFSLLFLFVAESFSQPQNIVETIYELGKCSEERKGEIVYVESDSAEYICFGKWMTAENSNENGTAVVIEKTDDTETAKPDKSPKEEPLKKLNLEYGEIIDSRDGQKYKTVKINNQVWMAQNLNFKTKKSHCFLCQKYGSFYTYYDAYDLPQVWNVADKINPIHKGICPDGFHIPSVDEWTKMLDYVAQESKMGSAVALKSANDWKKVKNRASSNDGVNVFSQDIYGFSVYPTGFINGYGAYRHEGTNAYFWTSNYGKDNHRAVIVYFDFRYDEAIVDYKKGKQGNKFSLRCVKND